VENSFDLSFLTFLSAINYLSQMIARRAIVNLRSFIPKSNSGFGSVEMSKTTFGSVEMSNKMSTDSKEGRLSGKVAIVTASTQG
jgi:hypothetical protein